MAPGDHKVQAWIGEKYKPLIIRGRPLHEQPSRLDFAEKRRNGDQNVDLWLDSRLYPLDPRSGKRPRMDSPGSLLEFVGEGENGLLGYVKSLESKSSGSMEQVVECDLLRARIDKLILQSGEDSARSALVIAALRNDLSSLQTQLLIVTRREHERHQLSNCMSVERESLVAENSNLKVQLHAQRVKAERDAAAHYSEILGGLNSRIVSVSKELTNAKARLQRLEKKPCGIRSHMIRDDRQDWSELAASTEGYVKASKRLARTVGHCTRYNEAITRAKGSRIHA